MTPTEEQAVAKLGCPIEEIGAVADTDAGVVILMADGSSYIDVPADQPDAEGKTGLMYHDAPHEDYSGTFPVYAPVASAPPAAVEPAPETEDTQDVASDEDNPVPAGEEPTAVPVRSKTEKPV